MPERAVRPTREESLQATEANQGRDLLTAGKLSTTGTKGISSNTRTEAIVGTLCRELKATETLASTESRATADSTPAAGMQATVETPVTANCTSKNSDASHRWGFQQQNGC
jgi:hypothetical protein